MINLVGLSYERIRMNELTGARLENYTGHTTERAVLVEGHSDIWIKSIGARRQSFITIEVSGVLVQFWSLRYFLTKLK